MLPTKRLLISLVLGSAIITWTIPSMAYMPWDNAGQTSVLAERFGASIKYGGKLTPADRVYYQRAVDEVSWKHTLWPDGNSVKPAYAATEAARAINIKVDDVLRKSNALSQLWGQQITGEMLQAEIDRMVHNSKQPAILLELFAALHNNPDLVAEVVARPALVDRLTRRFFAADSRFKGTANFDRWWTQARTHFGNRLETPRYNYYLPLFTQTALETGTWRPMAALPAATGTVVWTGSEMIVWGNGTDSGSRYNPATDTWSPTSTIDAPRTRAFHTATWTGTEMIVWGGCHPEPDFCDDPSGGRYNPSTDTWASTSTVNAPQGRKEHTAVWTGTEMIIWGGCTLDTNRSCHALPQGAPSAYNPVSDTWRVIPDGGIEGRTKHTAVWTGSEMIIFGGIHVTLLNTGARYNPSTNTWVATAFGQSRMEHTAVWTGREMIIWGGREPTTTSSFNTGGRYNPTTNSWSVTSLSNAPTGRIGHTAIWTGTEMIIWGGDQRMSLGFTNTGGRYRPDTDSWIPTALSNAPSARGNHVAVWTGSQMIVWSTADNKSGGRYNPLNDSWTPTNNNDSPPTVYSGVWTGTDMIVWGSHPAFVSGGPATGGRYNPATDEWRPMNLTGAPPPPNKNQSIAIVWTGTEMIVWGAGSTVFEPGYGGRYNPATDSWKSVTATNAPIARNFHSAVWSGSEMIVWGGQDLQGTLLNDGGRYNPATDSWAAIDTSRAPEARYLHTAIWSGSEMIVWGGVGLGSHLSTGARYDPAMNSWLPTSTLNAPLPRRCHSAVWTGTEMIIWGGRDGDYNNTTAIYETGGRYNPSADTWRPTELVNAPLARFKHSSVWTGSKMIIWGGLGKTGVSRKEVSTGAVYDPLDDTWSAISQSRAPSARSAHVAVWTGSEMITWGGDRSNFTGTATHGALFTPVAATPTPTPTPTPEVTPLKPSYKKTKGRLRSMGGASDSEAYVPPTIFRVYVPVVVQKQTRPANKTRRARRGKSQDKRAVTKATNDSNR
jgi:N-acetylneuraminic acid mutarotase